MFSVYIYLSNSKNSEPGIKINSSAIIKTVDKSEDGSLTVTLTDGKVCFSCFPPQFFIIFRIFSLTILCCCAETIDDIFNRASGHSM